VLDGEAYFDVVKQPQRPFIVHVSGYDIKVLGTAFNVRSYATDKTVETTLLRGLVEVTKQGKAQQNPIFLHPNEKLIVEKVAAKDAENCLITIRLQLPRRKKNIGLLRLAPQ
jgi:ferric-dicitrate binding protein FerR (iron transport regulator)